MTGVAIATVCRAVSSGTSDARDAARLRTRRAEGAIETPAMIRVTAITSYMRTVLNPETLPSNPAFSQVIVVRDPVETIYVGGQNAVTPDGQIVGESLGAQTEQALSNLEAALDAAGASIADVVQWTIAVVDGQSIEEGFAAFMARAPAMPEPPTISVHVVAGLANPQFLVEISAVAVR